SPYRHSPGNLYRYCTDNRHYTDSIPAQNPNGELAMEFLTLSALPAGMLFALVTSITPGPNNTMLLASGVNFGFRRTMPHLFGISIGVAILMLCVGFGLGEAFKRVP